MMRALVLMHQDDPEAREAADEYYFGPDLLVAPVLSAATQRSVYLPAGSWIDYWSGRRFEGRQAIVVDAPLDRIPLFVREGAILPRIPEDVMTLVPRSEFAGKVQTLDDRRIYEIFPGHEVQTITDFEGRRLEYRPASGELSIAGEDARVTVRFPFASPASVTLNGRKLTPGTPVEFSHHDRSVMKWR